MRIMPVLDLLGGRVVHGVAGERDHYRPVESVWTDSAAPLDVAQALREEFGFVEFYVADLDGIVNRRPNFAALQKLHAVGVRCLVDAGVRTVADAHTLFDAGAESVIICLETDPNAALLQSLMHEFDADRLIFSLDLKAGRPQGKLNDVTEHDAGKIVSRARDFGFRRLILLDLAAVGVSAGPATLELCRQCRDDFSDLEIITGGGVRGRRDLDDFAAAGADAVLIASAIHSGNLSRGVLSGYT